MSTTTKKGRDHLGFQLVDGSNTTPSSKPKPTIKRDEKSTVYAKRINLCFLGVKISLDLNMIKININTKTKAKEKKKNAKIWRKVTIISTEIKE